MKKIAGIIALALLLTACDNPKIDASSDQSMKESIQKVRSALPEEKKAQFDDAVQVVVFSQLNMKELMQAGASGGSSTVEDKMKTALDGKTGDEIINDATTIRQEREKRQKEQALQEIKALEEKQVASAKSAEEMKALKVESSRFYLRKASYGNDQPVLDISVENTTDKAVAKVYFIAAITSPAKSDPWYAEGLSYQTSGNLEPGEKANWKLEPNKYSEWGTLSFPSDAVLTVTVTRLEDAEGNSIFGDVNFSERDAGRLQQLKETFAAN